MSGNEVGAHPSMWTMSVHVGYSQRYQVRTKTIAGTSGRHTLLRYGLAQLIYAVFDVF
jgi:hypothetical protein